MRSSSSKLKNIVRRNRYDVSFDGKGAYYNYGQVTYLSHFFFDADNKIVKRMNEYKMRDICK